MREENWRSGDTIATTSGHIHRSETKHPQKRAGRGALRLLKRSARLPKLKPKTMKTRPADSRYDRGSLGGRSPVLFNKSAYLPVNPGKNPQARKELAIALEDWLTRPRAAELISGYAVRRQVIRVSRTG